MVGVEQGRVVAVRGDEASPVNRGLLCVKGYHLPGLLYGEDRLLYPQKRARRRVVHAASRGTRRSISREPFKRHAEQHGPGAVGDVRVRAVDGLRRLRRVRNGSRADCAATTSSPTPGLCMASAVSGFLTQFQSDEPMGCYQDLEPGDDFVLWGNNMAEMHPVLFSRILETKRQKPATRIVDIATRRTPTTDYADLHVLFKPGTDLALANGILHLLVGRGAHPSGLHRRERRVPPRHRGCEGRSATAASTTRPSATPSKTRRGRARSTSCARSCADYTPERVSEMTGVPVEQIRALAAIYGDLSRGTVSLWCMGVNQHVRGTWMNNLITDLHLITGKICRPGANPLSLTGQPSACGTAREVGTSNNRLPADMVVTNPEHRAEAERIWKLPAGTIPATPGITRSTCSGR